MAGRVTKGSRRGKPAAAIGGTRVERPVSDPAAVNQTA